ncbi:CAAX amino terminal protease self- immunity [Phycisphaerae bacterium RAS2]|nr:CAAX amino terminal protease self- immunity [Phycisphaerae bacterium RAS2]
MTAVLMLLAIPIVLWSVQSVCLAAARQPLRWRIDSRGGAKHLRLAVRIATQVGLLAVIVLYPVVRGEAIIAYYGRLLPPAPAAEHFGYGVASAALFLSVLFVIWLATQRLVVEVHHARKKWIRRLVLLGPTAMFGAFVEEFLFRGVLMADLLRSNWSPGSAVAISALVFAIAHYVRAVKRHWTFPGHIALGVLLGVAFLETGSLWLAAGLHAGGILVIMGVRPFVRYAGPAWLTGASIFPFAGVVGIAALVTLTAIVHHAFGGIAP